MELWRTSCQPPGDSDRSGTTEGTTRGGRRRRGTSHWATSHWATMGRQLERYWARPDWVGQVDRSPRGGGLQRRHLRRRFRRLGDRRRVDGSQPRVDDRASPIQGEGGQPTVGRRALQRESNLRRIPHRLPDEVIVHGVVDQQGRMGRSRVGRFELVGWRSESEGRGCRRLEAPIDGERHHDPNSARRAERGRLRLVRRARGAVDSAGGDSG